MENDDQTVPAILKKLASLLRTEIKHRKLEIPSRFGNGYCTGFIFNEHIRMLISHYRLNEDIILENPEVDASKKMLFFKFQNIFSQPGKRADETNAQEIPSVLIATSRINTDALIPIHTNTGAINIEVDADYLGRQFQSPDQSPVVNSLLKNTQPLLFEQMIDPSMQDIVREIIADDTDENFKLFFLRLKAEELICRLVIAMEKRDEKRLYKLNNQDVETLYKVKEKILGQLAVPPVINDLAAAAGMSPTKLKRLFRQIFGNSIFSYYQEFRMKEAAFLLNEKKYSVSEVGYRLGFTNLSHFSKIFKEHTGMKPKQYSMR
ncbi:MAG: AraC family transcriptional regulator [Chryseobacterium sp.]|uniref:helix-turn-helix domain-containing protein n=1 Tax=Chryseobacterium sp. TaxID=1871047 RepID=UPI0025BFFB29|nr:AraC family transcriptional regulator [Chryseobacterium sp.]MCJ7935768.1 AraC family transcriptional regulator [Chryseobacterium sp.]